VTTFQVPRDQAVADALSALIPSAGADHEVWSALAEMRAAATPGSGFHVAHVPLEVRPPIAAAARSLAAGDHPLKAQLEQLADGLDPRPAAAQEG